MEIENWISSERFASYLNRCQNNNIVAIKYYEANLMVSESTYIYLQALEVLLRNKIHQKLSTYYNTENWYKVWEKNDHYNELNQKIKIVIITLQKHNKIVNAANIISELTLGFWVQLFNSKYQKTLWKPLRNIFSNLPKDKKRRDLISSSLNKARKFRNRVFHFEPILWSPNATLENYKNIEQLILWLDSDYFDWIKPHSNFEGVLTKHIKILKDLGINLDKQLMN